MTVIVSLLALILGAIGGLFFAIKSYPGREVKRLIREFRFNEKKEFGEWLHYRTKATHELRIIVKPNCETLYSSTFIDAKGSYLFTLPTIDQYFSIVFINVKTDVVGCITNRELSSKTVVVTTELHIQEKNALKIPEGLTWMIARFGIRSADELQLVHQQQDELKIDKIEA
jgi:hypothetical protein